MNGSIRVKRFPTQASGSQQGVRMCLIDDLAFIWQTRAFLLAPFQKSPVSQVSVLGMRFHHFGVNGRLKRRESICL